MTFTPQQLEFLAQLDPPFTGEALFDCLTDLVFFIKNRLGQYVIVNDTVVKRCGFHHKSELIGRTADQVYPDPLGATYRQQDNEVLRDGATISNRLELQVYPGRDVGWCLTNKIPLKNHAGEVVGLTGISQDLHVAQGKGEDYARVARAIEHIQSHYDQSLKVRALAEMADLSEYQFEQRVRRIFQLTAKQFIQKVRMDAAVRRLRDTEDSIVTIALACGYADQSSFSRQFKLTVGLSPAEYRNAARSGLG